MSTKCPDCDSTYERVELHLAKSNCSYPNYSRRQKEILTGLLMGDANIDYQSAKNPRWRVSMINRDCLEYLSSIFSEHTTSVKLSSTAEESFENTKKSSIGHTVTNKNNYSDVYILRSYTNPELREFANWYSSGSKIFPEIELTPFVAKYWYVSDGSLRIKSGNPYISFGISNEIDNKKKIQNIFKRAGFDKINFFEYQRKDGTTQGSLQIRGSDESRKFLEYIGKPVPGFEYKWTEKYNSNKG